MTPHHFDYDVAHSQPIIPASCTTTDDNESSSTQKQFETTTTTITDTMSEGLKSFINELETCFKEAEGKVNPETVKQIFRKYSDKIDINDFEKYCLADTKSTYTRNLISKNPFFSLIVLVWNPRQHSSIHAHGGSQCWFRVLRGQVKECRWFVNPKQDTSLSPVNPTKEFIANLGAVGYIDDNNGVHCIVNMQDDISVSVHLYAPPYESCACYSEDTGEIFRGKVEFDSVDGELTQPSETMYNFLKEEREEKMKN